MLSTQVLMQSDSWNEFKEHLKRLSKKEKGDCFEALTKYYLRIDPVYASKLQNVWDLREVPVDLKKYLNLPDNDEGIDLIAETKEGGFWAIQCKYRSNELKSLTRHHIDTFTSLTFINCKNFELALVCTTADRFSHKLSDFYGTGLSLCCGDVWRSLGQPFFQRLHSYLDGKIVHPDSHQPRPHQQTAITQAHEHFVANGNNRGKLIMPCASGKSLASYWMAKSLGAKKILLAVPSLALIRQTLEVWANESQAEGQEVHWICVCSDTSVKDVGKDDPIVFSQDLGISVQTDPDKIAEWLQARPNGNTLVITTYQSGKAIAEATRKANFFFDLGIMDEAHKTVGNKNSLFGHLLYDENIPIKHRLFMTATERRYKGRSEEIVSMEDPEIYGDTFYLLSFKEALECQPPILSDYRIVTIAVTRSEVAELIKKNVYIRFKETDVESPEEAETLATAIALRKAMLKYPISHSVSFHSSVTRAKVFRTIHDSLNTVFPEFGGLDTFHVSGKTPTAVRSRELDNFASSDKALITNARCLTEGIDVPGIDCVLFADPKKSTIDIVQGTGRALRPSPGKELGYVIIPLLIEDGTDLYEMPSSSSFESILSVLKALASNDERIIEYFRTVSKGRPQKSGNNTFVIDVPIGLQIDLQHFADSVEVQLWSRLAKLSWRPFNEARKFVRNLGLQSKNDWARYRRGEFPDKPSKPEDIPANPRETYKDSGWTTWGDWLGTGTIAPFNKEYRLFHEATEFARSLGLKGQSDWARYCRGEFPDKPSKPEDIPAAASKTYKDSGWTTWGDWLGTGIIATQKRQYLPFEEAREFARGLGLKGQNGWTRYCRGEFPDKPSKPEDIPAIPYHTYKDNGWDDWGDWLGTGIIATQKRQYLPFEEAREFARSLGLKSHNDWRRYCRGEFPDKPPKPEDIPANPHNTYKGKGWTSLGNWLGTGTIAPFNRQYLPFEEARDFARSLGLKSKNDWRRYCRGEFPDKPPKPEDIPANPHNTYKGKGWTSLGDWLGTGTIAPFNRTFRLFGEARDFARSLGLKSKNDWAIYCKGEFAGKSSRPEDIPSNPSKTYKNSGWTTWGDWLGTGTIALFNREYRLLEDAREFARMLGLQSRDEWKIYCRGEFPDKPQKPEDIPANPYQTYRDNGWFSWGDWLGTGTIASQYREYRPFEEAREFARSLGLKKFGDWTRYCRGKFPDKSPKPDDVPAAPERTYKGKGWTSLGDWLGTGTIANRYREYRPFEEARDFARSLGLKSHNDWRRYCRGEFPDKPPKPEDIPANPYQTYKGKGWTSSGDWLGTGTIAPFNREYRLFGEARDFARSLGLKSKNDWAIYCKGELQDKPPKPEPIPAGPSSVYKNKGWISWGDWLGTKPKR